MKGAAVSILMVLAAVGSLAAAESRVVVAQPQPAVKWMDSGMAEAWAAERGASVPAPLRVLQRVAETQDAATLQEIAKKLGVPLVEDRALVIFDLDAASATTALATLTDLGGTVGARSGGRVRAKPQRRRTTRYGGPQAPDDPRGEEQVHLWLPLSELQQAIATPGVVRLRAPRAARTHGIISEGVDAIEAVPWQSFVPPTGLPLGRAAKVAVIDAGFLGHEALLGDDLPDSVTTAVFCPSGGDTDGCNSASFADMLHGSAVAEIVHDVAPNAELLLLVVDLVVGFNNNVRQALEFAAAEGADIVTMSIGSDRDNRDGSGPGCAAANQLPGQGMVFTVSAGNSGDRCEHEHYDFVRSGISPGGSFGEFQFFPDKLDPILNEFILPQGEGVQIGLQWNAFGGPPPDDFDLLLACDLDGDGLDLFDPDDFDPKDPAHFSGDFQCGDFGSEPREEVFFQNTTGSALECGYAVIEFDPANCPHGANTQFDTFLTVDSCLDMEENTSSFTVSHPADCTGVTAVGAVCVFDNQLEFFSSQGPTLDNRIKPELCAPDNTSGVSFGNSLSCSLANGFPGTSAAAPHVAGSLALLLEKIGGSFSVAQCLEILEARGIDINGDNAVDNLCGSGRVCLSSLGCN
jgi:subtilisin family serine protease